MSILLKGGRIVDPSQNINEEMDILIEKGAVARTGKDLYDKTKAEPDLKIFDLRNKIVAPGLIDIHTHLREPGFEYKETIQTGSEAAVAGGFTSIACMPNTDPINDNRSVTEFICRKALQCNLANVYPVAAISKRSEGITITEFGDLKDAGAVAFSDDGRPVMNSALMRRALEYASSLGILIISHCEDTSLSAGGLMNEGFVSTELGLQGTPNIAEDIMVARDIAIADFTNTPVHIAHVSTSGSVRLISQAKERGIKVTAETAPHYFSLTDEALRGYDTCAKVYPPLRNIDDVTAIKKGLHDGSIDAIACDHAPHSSIEKDIEFVSASFGIVGLETSLSLSLKLVADGILTLDQLIFKMSVNPAMILGIPKGTLKIGSDADITVIDTKKQWTVDINKFRSKSKNSPFNGWELTGKAVLTIVGGQIKYSDEGMV